MATAVDEIWKAVHRCEKQLHGSTSESHTTPADINLRLDEYRAACDTLIFTDFAFACAKNVELVLWDAHSRVNNWYRKKLSYFRDGGGKKKVVEQRKLLKTYLEFIKSGQRYYRGYIQALGSRFGGIPEVEAVAQKFTLHHTTDFHSDSSSFKDLRKRVLASCHQTLIRLGDLSRYRETELVRKERNWGPAIGYYDLAGAIRPTCGASHNQLAVIAIADGNHLRSTYHLYRALAVEEPHATAKSNLEIGFKKIVIAHEKGQLIDAGPSRDPSESGKALSGWFVLLHAQCYKGNEFSEHDELESEVLSQLAIELKERPLASTLQKIVLVNMAAEYFAGVQLRASPDSEELRQAYLFFLRLNVKTMFTLLQVLQPELEYLVIPGGEQTKEVDEGRSEKITAVTRRVLPALRQYSSWLSCNSVFLVAQIGDTSLNVQIKELWKIYANTLTLLAATFPASDLPSIDYLLEEDEDTIGFKPFEDASTRDRYQNGDVRKLSFHSGKVERQHPNLEMMGRVRSFLTDGLTLALNGAIPIDLVDGTTTFAYHEEGMPSEIMASPQGHCPTLSSTSIQLADISAKSAMATDAASLVGDEVVQSASASISANVVMNEMVDNIVGSETTNDSEHQDYLNNGSTFRAPPTPPSYSFDDSLAKTVGNDTSYGLLGALAVEEFLVDHQFASPQQPSQQGTPRPLLPSIYNSVFAPTAEEVASRPGTANGLSPTRPTLQQTPNGYTMNSSISSMQTPSSLFLENPSISANNRYNLAYGPTSHGAHNLHNPQAVQAIPLNHTASPHDIAYDHSSYVPSYSHMNPYTP